LFTTTTTNPRVDNRESGEEIKERNEKMGREGRPSGRRKKKSSSFSRRVTEFLLTREQLARRNYLPVRVRMDESKREVVRETKAQIGSYSIKYSVVCQEGCYPDKKHANQDAFCANIMHDGESLLLGVFDGHGAEGESCAQIASSIFPQILTQLSREKEEKRKADSAMRDGEDDDGENESGSVQTEEERLMRLSSSGSETTTTAKKRDRYKFLTAADLDVKNHCDSPQSSLFAHRTISALLSASRGGGSSSNSNSSRERSKRTRIAARKKAAARTRASTLRMRVEMKMISRAAQAERVPRAKTVIATIIIKLPRRKAKARERHHILMNTSTPARFKRRMRSSLKR